MFPIPAFGDYNGPTKSFSKDPETFSEFIELVQGACQLGAIQVTFPSGEWNWYCYRNTPSRKDRQFATWASRGEIVDIESLGKWLAIHKVAAVNLSVSTDCKPRTFFEIEQSLRSHEIPYWVSSELSTTQKENILITEAAGGTLCHAKNEDLAD